MHFVLGMGEVIQGWDLGLLGMDGQISEFYSWLAYVSPFSLFFSFLVFPSYHTTHTLFVFSAHALRSGHG